MQRWAALLSALVGLVSSQNLDPAVLEVDQSKLFDKAIISPFEQTPSEVYDIKKSQAKAAKDAIAANVAALSVTSTLNKRADCDLSPSGPGPIATPDTDVGFLSFPAFEDASTFSETPDGYYLAFQNRNAISEGSTYMGLLNLDNYNVSACAAACDATNGCLSFNIFFERLPAVDPGYGCPNPPSTTFIRCSLWGSRFSSGSATNYGQYRGPSDESGQSFHIVLAGSNGYSQLQARIVQLSYSDSQSFNGAAALDTAIYDAAAGGDSRTLIGTLFYPQLYDPSICAAVCNATTATNKQNAVVSFIGDGSYSACNYFNAYVFARNGIARGIFCALFTRPANPSLDAITDTEPQSTVTLSSAPTASA